MNTCHDCKNDLVCHDQGECLRPTPETEIYAAHKNDVYEFVDPEWDWVVSADSARRLERELAELREWKRQQLEVESQWDCQKVGKMLGVPIGAHVRPHIEPKVANLNATIEQQAETLQSAIELIRRVSTGPATPNDAWQWLKQRGLDKYQHVNPDRKSHDQHA